MTGTNRNNMLTKKYEFWCVRLIFCYHRVACILFVDNFHSPVLLRCDHLTVRTYTNENRKKSTLVTTVTNVNEFERTTKGRAQFMLTRGHKSNRTGRKAKS